MKFYELNIGDIFTAFNDEFMKINSNMETGMLNSRSVNAICLTNTHLVTFGNNVEVKRIREHRSF